MTLCTPSAMPSVAKAASRMFTLGVEIAEAGHHPAHDRDRRDEESDREEPAADQAEAVDGEELRSSA